MLATVFTVLALDHASFATLDRLDDGTRFGASLGANFYEGDFAPDLGLRVDLYGAFMLDSGILLHGNLPFSHVFVEGEDTDAVGNIELGGGYVVRGANVDIVLRGGLLLPTAGDSIGDYVTNLLTAYGRLTDIYTIIPETMALRLAVSPVFRQGILVARADLGLDVALSSPDTIDPDPALRINLGAGVDTGTVGAFVELVNVGTLGELDDGDEDRFVHTLGVTGRFTGGGRFQPGLSLVVPFNEEVDADVWVLALDLQAVL